MYNMIASPNDLRGYRIRIYPTEDQKKFLDKQIQLFRFVYNWAVAIQLEQYKLFKEGKEKYRVLNLAELNRKFVEFKNKPENEWILELESHSAREALRSVIKAYEKFFNHLSKRPPKFKSKKNCKKFFQFRNDPNAFYFKDKYVRIPGLPFHDKILCKSHHIPMNTRYYKGTIYYDGKYYYLSCVAEVPNKNIIKPINLGNIIGIDVGYRKMAITSDNRKYYHPDTHILSKRKRRQQSRLAKMRQRRIKQSIQTKTKFEEIPMTRNEEKLSDLYYKTRARLRNINRSHIDRVASDILASNPDTVIMENIKLRNLVKSNGRNMKGVSLYDFRRRVANKCKDKGINFVLADSFFPSTKICSSCGLKHNVYTEEIFKCPHCGFIIDRDLNAAINLSHYPINT